MAKLLLFSMLCLAISLTFARQDKDRFHFNEKKLRDRHHEIYSGHRKLLKFCSNNTIAQNYLTRILTVVNDLQGNSSYSSILKSQSTHFITYLNDTINQELLHRDCESFVKGLKAAKKADKVDQREQKRLAKTIRKQLKQVARDISNGKGFYEFDN